MWLVDDTLLLPAPQSLRALSLIGLAPRWQHTFDHASISGLAVVLSPEALIIAALSSEDLMRGEGALVAFDLSGNVRWRWSPGVQKVSAPCVTFPKGSTFRGGVVCVTVDARTLFLIDLATGVSHPGVGLSASASLAAPAVADEVAYIPCRGSHLLAVGLDGRPRWRFPDPSGLPDLTGLSSDGWLDKMPVVIGDRVFAVSSAGSVYALNAHDGSLAWRVPAGPAGKPLSPPATDAERLYIGARDGVCALDPSDGHALWRFATGRRVEAQPVVLDGIVYAACHDHHLYALDAATGAEVWRHEVQRRIEVSPVVTPDGLCVVVDQGGTLTSISRYLKEAEQWAVQGEALKQAEALEQHVRRLGHTLPADTDRADVWSTVAQLYDAEDQAVRAQACRREAARCLRLPILALDLKHGGLVRDIWSQVGFTVRNDGYGAARNLIIHAEGDQFEGQIMSTREIASVKIGQQRIEPLDIRPRAIGDVPLRVRVEYADEAGLPHEIRQTIYIAVAPDESTRRPEQTINVIVSGAAATEYPQPETLVDSLRRQLDELRASLRLVEERKAQYVQEVDIPLQFIKDERRLRERIAELETRLKGL